MITQHVRDDDSNNSEKNLHPVLKFGKITVDPVGLHRKSIEDAETWFLEAVEAAKENGPFALVKTISPELAYVMLGYNKDNRNIPERRLQTVMDDINEDRFVLNGETIIISDDGFINDGQTRLMACCKTGKSIETFIAFGLPRETRETIDIGNVRTPGNILHMFEGVEDSNRVAAIARMFYVMEKYGNPNYARGTVAITKPTVTNYFKANREMILEAARAVAVNKEKKFGGAGVLAYCYWRFKQKSETQALDFMAKLLGNEELPPDNPIAIAKGKFTLFRKDFRGPLDAMEMIMRTWNFYRRQSRITKAPPLLGYLPDVE